MAIVGKATGIVNLETAEDLLRATVNSARVVLFALDAEGRFLLVRGHGLQRTPLADLDLVGLRVDEVFPGDARVTGLLEHALAGEEMSARLQAAGRHWEVRVTPVLAGDGELQRVTGVAIDVTDNAMAERTLRETAEELARSNRELQDLAYVVSHDLQEPLRMVTSYMQLLDRRYKGQLDETADEFIHYAVDGAERMENLIKGLLQYSRINTRGHPMVEVDAQEALRGALARLAKEVDESGAIVTSDALPTVTADPEQLALVFEHLIDNAIKFGGNEPPRVHVGVRRDATHWVFSVEDNGIGVEPTASERVFIIFQRLHGDAYPGTGLGLGLARRIVQRHRGFIWLDTKARPRWGHGSVFRFSLPASQSVDE